MSVSAVRTVGVAYRMGAYSEATLELMTWASHVSCLEHGASLS